MQKTEGALARQDSNSCLNPKTPLCNNYNRLTKYKESFYIIKLTEIKKSSPSNILSISHMINLNDHLTLIGVKLSSTRTCKETMDFGGLDIDLGFAPADIKILNRPIK